MAVVVCRLSERAIPQEPGNTVPPGSRLLDPPLSAPTANYSEEFPGPMASRPSMQSDGPAPEERELGSRFARRDPEAFEEAFARYREVVYVLGILELGDADEAQDLVQDTFRRAWVGAATLREPDKLRAWLMSIARKQAIDMGRKRSHLPRPTEHLPERPTPSTDDPLNQAVRQERAQRIQFLLNTVPEQFRMVLGMRLIQGCSYQEVATTLGIPLHSVKNAVGRGGAILYQKIRQSPELMADLTGEDRP